MPPARNHYQILNVAPDAEPVVIEAAYRALMKKYHPDQAVAAAAPGPSAAEINHAFATLRDAERRADYDRRERTRSQSVQLAAAYQPPPSQRVSRAFGWGGWIVSAVLGGVLALMAERANELSLARADASRAAASAEPDMRSQPTLPKEPFLTPPPAAVAEAEVTTELAEAAPVPVAALPPAPPAPRAAPAQAQRRVARPKPRRPQVQARRPRTAAEKDFLEREGYIY
jgi:curved DNA-binding protein CbpA